MRIAKKLHKDEETILQFLDVFGGGSVALGTSSKRANPGFFISANTFIIEYIEGNFFKKEGLLINALEASGFAPDDGPVGAMRKEQSKSTEAADILLKAAKAWQAGDEAARVDVVWAASEYTSTLRRHLDRLRNLVYPLLEQNISFEDEQKIVNDLNAIVFESPTKNGEDKYAQLIESLGDELSDWN